MGRRGMVISVIQICGSILIDSDCDLLPPMHRKAFCRIPVDDARAVPRGNVVFLISCRAGRT